MPVYSLILLLCLPIFTVVFAAAFHDRRSPGAWSLMALALCAAIYTGGYALELASPTLQEALFWNRLQYLGIAPLGGLWMVIAATHSGCGSRLGPVMLIAVFMVPCITILAHTFGLVPGLHYAYVESISTGGDEPPLH